MATHSSTLAWKIPWMKEPGGLQSTGSQKSDTTEPLHFTFIIGDWNAKGGSQETPGVTGKFGLGVQNEAGQRLAEFSQGDQTSYSKYPLPTQEKTLHIDITRWSIPKSD